MYKKIQNKKMKYIIDFLLQCDIIILSIRKGDKNMKPYDLGMVCGRFQHIHKGHESLFDTALMLCDRVLILVGSAQEVATERNPFDIQTRMEMIKEVYGDRVIVKPLNDLTNEHDITSDWGKYVLGKCQRVVFKKPELMIYGNDESRSKWFDKEDITDMTEVIINRGKIDISATKIRQMLVEDDRQEWMKWVNPKLHKHYDRIRAELMAVDFYKGIRGNKK